jgi:hypothetical protein
MPFNGQQIYSKPAGTTAAPNTTIESAKFNEVIDDLVNAINYQRPGYLVGFGEAVWKATKTILDADLAHAADMAGVVYADSTAANNGVYVKTGASGAGSWTRKTDLPYSFIPCVDSGAGTANAIQLVANLTPPTIAGTALFLANVFEANTGAVTVSINGATAKALNTKTGASLAAGYLAANDRIMFVDDGTDYRLTTDVVSAAIVAAADAAAAEAVAAAASVSGYGPSFKTVALMLADTAIASASTGQIWTANGFRYEVVTSGEHLTTAGGIKLKVLPDGGIYHVEAFGVLGVSESANTAIFQKMFAAAVDVGATECDARNSSDIVIGDIFYGIHTLPVKFRTGNATFSKNFNNGSLKIPSFCTWEMDGTTIEPTTSITSIPGVSPYTALLETWHTQTTCTGSGTSYTLANADGVHVGSIIAINGLNPQYQFGALTLGADIASGATSLTIYSGGVAVSDSYLGSGWVTVRIDNGVDIEFVRGVLEGSGVLNLAASTPESGRAKNGTTARAWTAGDQILVYASSVRTVTAVVGNVVTLDSAPEYAIAATNPCYFGAVNSAITGRGHIDGGYDNVTTLSSLWSCLSTVLSNRFEIGPEVSLAHAVHGGFFAAGTRNLRGRPALIEWIGKSGSGLGASVWLFGNNRDGEFSCGRITNGNIALAADDKSSGFGYYGLDTPNDNMIGTIGSVIAHVVGIDITASIDCFWDVLYSECSGSHGGLFTGSGQHAGVSPARSGFRVAKMHTFRAPTGNALTGNVVMLEGKTGRDISATITMGASTVPYLSANTNFAYTMTGAKVGDHLTVNPLSDLASGVAISAAQISLADTLRVQFINISSTTDLSGTQLRARAVGPW